MPTPQWLTRHDPPPQESGLMWARLSAGIVPGFFLAAALLGLLSWLLPGRWESTIMVGLLAFFPLWIGIVCAALRFSSGRRAWLCLGSAAVAGLGLLRLLQASGWVG
jgi:hypothetical protein